MISQKIESGIKEKLEFLYSKDNAREIYSEIEKKINLFNTEHSEFADNDNWVDEKDVFLICYGDSIKGNENKSLENLKYFSDNYLNGHINNIHILPFFPYSSDDGFSVIDYYKVDPDFGDWNDIEKLNKNFNLMFDGVINHISSKSEWFKGYLNGNKKYENFFIEAEESEELKKVVRPRAKPLLHEYDSVNGMKKVWTTFSRDQIDLNYQSKDLLLEIIDLLLFYVVKGSRFIRLDAIGYLWKKIGTTCIHLEETHKMIQLFRDILDATAPSTVLITETNVPHEENISYFGNGNNEAQMVYQFPLPPLVLHGIHNGNGEYLSDWAKKLELQSNKTTFFNFLASHDGVGLMPAKGILPESEIEGIVERVKNNGGLVSYKHNSDGSKSPYELNVNYYDALIDQDENRKESIDKFLLSQSILLTIIGTPAIYIHSLLGSRNYTDGVKETGRNRTINREKLVLEELISEIEEDDSLRNIIFNKYISLIDTRKQEKAFHPNADMEVLEIDKRIFAYIRENDNEKILVVNNLSKEEFEFSLPESFHNKELIDIITNNEYIDVDKIKINSYQSLWIKIK